MKRVSDSSPASGSVSDATPAFEKWRGDEPSSGYGRDIISWRYETEKLRKAWDAGRDFERSIQKQN